MMMRSIQISIEKAGCFFRNLTKTKSRVYLLGFFFAFLITLKEILGMSYNNFQIFAFGSLDFWAGINPYSDWNHLSLRGNPLDVFLYGPLFSILFTPFAILPGWTGPLCWNIFTYSLFFFSIFSLPDQISFEKKKFIFFFSILLLFRTLLSVQFNPVVTAMFLFSFTLLEKNKSFAAVFLILLSGFTKVYGIFQLAMLLFYPRFWKNISFAVLTGIFLLFLPLIHLPLNGLADYYQSWFATVMAHSDAMRFFSIYRPLSLLFQSIEPFAGFISVSVLLVILFFVLLKLEYFKDSFSNRARFIGILMGWVILFGLGSEKHTYVIATAGYTIWYLFTPTTRIDKVLLWLNFILLGIMPIDFLCPTVISDFVLSKLHLGVLVFTLTWGIMVIKTFTSLDNKKVFSET